jgi:hypothetical protein
MTCAKSFGVLSTSTVSGKVRPRHRARRCSLATDTLARYPTHQHWLAQCQTRSIGFLRLAMTGQEKIQHAAELDRKRQTAGVVDCCQLKIAFNIIMKTNTTLELTAVRDHVCLKVGVGFGLGRRSI